MCTSLMFKETFGFEIGSNADEYLYRYIPENRLESFLTEGLFLSRVDKFEDPFELSNIFELKRIYSQTPTVTNERNIANDPDIQQIAEVSAFEVWNREYPKILHRQKKTCISCWFLGKSESFAQWKLYADKGFLLKISVSNFRKIFEHSDVQATFKTGMEISDAMGLRGLFGKVSYYTLNDVFLKDKLTNSGNYPDEYLFTKNMAFAHEQELRLVAQFNQDVGEDGIFVKMNTEQYKCFWVIPHPGYSTNEIMCAHKTIQCINQNVRPGESELKDLHWFKKMLADREH